MELETYGDLKKLISAITLKQKGTKVGKMALDTIIGEIPGANIAKSSFDFIKAAFGKPDTKKTSTWLDKLDVDDDMSAIVDDTVENGFLKVIAKTLESESDTKPLEQDFNMNAKMVAFLGDEYSGRTISGIKEVKYKKNKLMKKSTLRTLIREQIKRTLREEDAIKPPQADVTKVSDSPLMARINNKLEWEQLMDSIISMEVPSTTTSQKIAILTKKLGELRKSA